MSFYLDSSSSNLSIESKNAAETVLLTIKVDIADNVRNVVTVRPGSEADHHVHHPVAVDLDHPGVTLRQQLGKLDLPYGGHLQFVAS